MSRISLWSDTPRLDQAREAVVNLKYCQDIQRAIMMKEYSIRLLQQEPRIGG